MAQKLIDPTYDIGFKIIFGREQASEELLIDLLNSIFAEFPDIDTIVRITYKNNERQVRYRDSKGIRYDIMCETSSGRRFIVEMQKRSQVNFFSRAVYYVSRAIADQGNKEEEHHWRERWGDAERTSDLNEELGASWDYSLLPVIGVFFCDFRMAELAEKAVTHVVLTDLETHQPVSDVTRYVFIQLPYIGREKEDCHTACDQWVYNIKNMGTMDRVAFTEDREIFKKLESVGNISMLSAEERADYEYELKQARDRTAQLKYAIQEGRAEGEALGMAKGVRQAALRMLKAGLSDEMVSGILEMPLSEVEILREKL